MFNGIEIEGLKVKVKKIIDFQVPKLLSYCLTSKLYRTEVCLRNPHLNGLREGGRNLQIFKHVTKAAYLFLAPDVSPQTVYETSNTFLPLDLSLTISKVLSFFYSFLALSTLPIGGNKSKFVSIQRRYFLPTFTSSLHCLDNIAFRFFSSRTSGQKPSGGIS